MDYEYFDKVLRKHGLQDEPAFERVLVEISQLPPMPGNPLGLYYPDPDHEQRIQSGTIWVPDDADEDTILHELGHRYGHYYHDDLSETFAEQYRLSHQPAGRNPAHQDEDHTLRNILIGVGAVAALLLLRKA